MAELSFAPCPSVWPRLADDEVHVWRFALHAGPETLSGLASVLADDEHERAARFVFARDRRRFVVARATLRHVLGRYAVKSPQALAFEYGPHGKPSLVAPKLSFNLAHSEDLALLAVARSGRLGIDLEAERALDLLSLARTTFSAREAAALAALPLEARARAFFHVWTCKEACVKALGQGLAYALDRFEVGLEPPARLLRCELELADWALVSFEPAPGFAAALACDRPRRVRAWQWPATPAEC